MQEQHTDGENPTKTPENTANQLKFIEVNGKRFMITGLVPNGVDPNCKK